MKGNVISDIAQTFLSNIIAKLINLARGFILARALGPADFGLWSALQLILVYGALANFGSLNAMNREVPAEIGRGNLFEVDRIERTVLGTIVVVSAVCIPVSFLVIYVYGRFNGVSMNAGIGVVIISVVLGFFNILNFSKVKLRTKSLFTRLGALNILEAFLAAALPLTFVWWLGLTGGLLGLAIGYGMTGVASLHIAEQAITFEMLRVRISKLLNLVRIGFPIMVTGLLFGVLTTLDRLLIVKYLGSEMLGYYSLGAMMSGWMGMLGQAVTQVFYPRLVIRFWRSQKGEGIDSYVDIPTKVLSVLVAGGIGIVYLIIPDVIRIIAPEFLNGIDAGRILVIGVFFLTLFNLSANHLLTINRQMIYLAVTVGCIIVCCIVDYYGIILGYGILGVAYGSAMSYGIFCTAIVVVSLVYRGIGALRIIFRLLFYYAPLVVSVALAVGAESARERIGIVFCVLCFVILYLGFGLVLLLAAKLKQPVEGGL